MVWLPLTRLVAESAAAPLDSVCAPRLVVPSRNVTVPVGVPVAGGTGETVAVNVTERPYCDGLELELSTTGLLAALIVWLRAGEVTAPKLLSPE
jgi:hypothetical protein